MRTVLLLSGGIDSFAAGRAAQERGSEIHAVTFDYGQVNRRELRAASSIVEALRVRDSLVMKLDLGLGAYGRSKLLVSQNGASILAPKGDFGNYVPARHAIFLSCALGFAEVVHADNIVMGASCLAMGTRQSLHRDCQPPFFEAFQAMARVATDVVTDVAVVCPVMDMTKRDIVAYAHDQRLDLGLTWTCHGDGDLQCGQCRTCQLRLHAFYSLGVEDPVPYERTAAYWIDQCRQRWFEEDGSLPPDPGRPEKPRARPVWRHFG